MFDSFVIPVDYSLPGSSVQGISQARILEWPEEEIPEDEKPSMLVDRICLMRSDRTKHGMVYTEIR